MKREERPPGDPGKTGKDQSSGLASVKHNRYGTVEIEGKSISMEVDTGSAVSLISQDTQTKYPCSGTSCHVFLYSLMWLCTRLQS